MSFPPFKLISLMFLAVLLVACSGQPTESTPPGPGSAQATEAKVESTKAPTETSPAPTATPVSVPTPLVEAAEGRIFTYYGLDPATPIVPRGPLERWDGLYINPGGVLYHDGQFHMFRNGFKDWPGLVGIGYMISDDGLAWMEVQEEPIFTSDQVPYLEAGEGADVSSVVVLDDGTWVMYFHRVSNSNGGVIGRATASSPTGPWEVDPDPVLLPGGEGTWDAFSLEWPNVVATDEGLVMYYSGRPSRTGQRMIGRATSADGVNWTKHDDPATTEIQFAESDPVLTPDETWTTDGVDRMRAQLTPEGWVMVYQGGALIKRGLAFSEDGIHWVRHPDNPVLELEDFPLSGTMWDTNLLYHDGVYYYYTEIGSMAGTDLYLAIHEGEIVPEDLPSFDDSVAASTANSATLPDEVEVLDASSLITAPGPSPIYTRHLDTNIINFGTYTLQAGTTDDQPSHSQDEVYYILEGAGVLDVDGEKIPVSNGSLVYVRAQVPHHFEEITEDLQVLVFFSKRGSSEKDPDWSAFEMEDLLAGLESAGELTFLDAATLDGRLMEIASGTSMPLDGGWRAVYLVIQGDGKALLGETSVEFIEGMLLYYPRDLQTALEAGEAGLVVLELGATP